MTIGEFIHRRRTELGLTLEDIGNATGVGKSTVKKWETGFISNMRRDRINALAKILKVSPIIFINNYIDDYEAAINGNIHNLSVGERIKKVREERNISQTELADAVNLSKQNLYKYENNIITNIPFDKIEAIAKYLEVSPVYLMGWANKTTASNNQQPKLTKHEEKVIIAYRDKPEMQPAVDKLLGVEEIHTTSAVRAARSFGDKSKIDRNADIDEQRFIDAPESDIDM